MEEINIACPDCGGELYQPKDWYEVVCADCDTMWDLDFDGRSNIPILTQVEYTYLNKDNLMFRQSMLQQPTAGEKITFVGGILFTCLIVALRFICFAFLVWLAIKLIGAL